MHKLLQILLVTLFFLLLGCIGEQTNNPGKVFKYWAGLSAPDGVQPVNGDYWESPHWTKEYILFLEIKASRKWINEYLVENQITDTSEEFSIPQDAPDWFKPDSTFVMFGNGFTSTYYVDSKNNRLFIYEIQL